MHNRIKSFIQEDKQYFFDCETDIVERNYRMLRKGSVLYAFVLCFYTVFVIITDQPQLLQTMYYVFDAFHLCLCTAIILSKRLRKKNSFAISVYCACLELSILSFFALEGVFTTTTQHSLYIPIAILLVLLLFIHRAVYAYVITLIYLISFTVMSCLYKIPQAYTNDIYIAIATLMSASIGYVMIAQMRHREGTALIKYERLSLTDQLTGMYNKVSIQKICEQILSDADRTCTFIIIDIDNFKSINDRYGHDVGDEVLCAVSMVMKSDFGETDFIGRFGGDEFIVIMDNCKDIEIIRNHLEILLNHIKKLTFSIEGLQVQCSAGITLKNENDTAQTIFKRADTALYQVKNGGKGCYKII